ncbi:hypothetical protein [Thauera sinica]|uniref:Secreted protein n=1 Tax=Thauera sinica TaxID=2665146 RepID=A0ABW1AYP7_9RHOO|nr:hypothetical protein [Thauera sp. K11]ATE58743.1 hypothetical protein CCZ27_01140 [Thauera sp. K11]
MSDISGTTQHRHVPLLRVAAAAWLLLISAAAVINHVAVSNLDRDADNERDMRIAVLEGRLAELAHHVEQGERQPAALPLARYESERQALDRRLDALEQALGERPTAESLLSLRARIEQLEARPDTGRSATPAAVRPRPPTPPKPQVIEPPFRVIGAELRADERFLSILPADAGALSQVRLLRPGEAEAGWRLDAIEGNAAVFRHSDAVRRLAVPAR